MTAAHLQCTVMPSETLSTSMPQHRSCFSFMKDQMRHGFFYVHQLFWPQQRRIHIAEHSVKEEDYSIHTMARYSYHDALKACLKADKDGIDIYNDHGMTALHIAAQTGNAEEIDVLVSHDADINKQDQSSGKTALHFACETGFVDGVRILCDHRANPNIQSKSGKTPLHFACQYGHLACVHMLIERSHALGHPVHMNAISNHYKTALLFACENHHYSIVSYLREKGANLLDEDVDYTKVDSNQNSLLHVACMIGDLRLAQMFLDRYHHSRFSNIQGQTPLHKACFKRHADIVQLLLRYPRERNSREFLGYFTPLHIACSQNDLDLIHLLVDKGESPYVHDCLEKTPLDYIVDSCTREKIFDKRNRRFSNETQVISNQISPDLKIESIDDMEEADTLRM